MTWDVVVVGAGPAGCAAALGALTAQPGARVLLLDRAAFPRDKACGDGIAPHALDVLSTVGLGHLLHDLPTVRDLELRRGAAVVTRAMARPAWVVPRTVFDHRLVQAAVGAGAVLHRRRVRDVRRDGDGVVLDGVLRARAVVGADGAYSVVRPGAGLGKVRSTAVALRGYAPTPPQRAGRQVITFGRGRLSYAWSFDRGDGLSNVGYGEVLGRRRPTRAGMLAALERLLPGAGRRATGWRAHHLPLAGARLVQPDGPVLLAGDAAGLVNPVTGEGITYALASGVLAGRAAVAAQAGLDAGAQHRAATRSLLGAHVRHTAVVGRLLAVPPLVGAGLRSAGRDQQVFDDLVELGLGSGLVTRHLVGGISRGLLG